MNLIAIMLLFFGGAATNFMIQLWTGHHKCQSHGEMIAQLIKESLPLNTVAKNKLTSRARYKSEINMKFKEMVEY
jgi:hypothetical protein